MVEKIAAGNWKMNHNYDEATGFVQKLLPQLKTVDTKNVEMMIAPSFLFAEKLKNLAKAP